MNKYKQVYSVTARTICIGNHLIHTEQRTFPLKNYFKIIIYVNQQ